MSRSGTRRLWSQKELDTALPTLVRYLGLVATLALLVAGLFVGYVEVAPGFVPTTGMMLYKTVRNAAGSEET